MIYSTNQIADMLVGYKEVKIGRLQDIPRYTRIRYCDQERFKPGGMLLNVNVENNYITLKNGTFIWKVNLDNIKKV